MNSMCIPRIEYSPGDGWVKWNDERIVGLRVFPGLSTRQEMRFCLATDIQSGCCNRCIGWLLQPTHSLVAGARKGA